MACFDQFGAVVFGSLCHLTAGDAAAAQRLLIQTFTHGLPAKSSAYEAADGSLDRRAVVVAAHHCFLQDPHAAATGSGPVAALTPIERAVINLDVSERMRSPEINFAVRMAENDADYVAEAALRRLNSETYGRSPVDVLAACEVWFDDAMRAQCRTEIEQALAFAPPPTDGDGIVVQNARSRRLTIGGSVAATIVAVIAIGAWLAPSNESPSTDVAGLAPTTTASGTVSRKDPSELPDPTSTTAAVSPSRDSSSQTADRPGFILNPPPDGFVISSATSDERMLPEAAWLDVWSTPGATRSEGQWFSVRASIDSAYPVLPNASREIVGGNVTLSSVDSTGVRSVVERVGGVTLEFQSFGLSSDDVRRLILATDLTSDGAIERTDRLDEVTRRMELVWSGPIYDGAGPPGLIGRRAHAVYTTPDGSQQIDVVTSEQVPNDLTVSGLLTPPPAPYTPEGNRMVVLSDVGALVGVVPANRLRGDTGEQSPKSFAQWHSGTRTVTLIGRLPLEQLIQIARTAHLASDSQWASMTTAVPIVSPDPASFFQVLSVLGQNVTEHGELWTLSLVDADCTMIATQKQEPGIPDANDPVIYGGDASFCVTIDPSQPLLQFATVDATLIAVLFDSPPAAAFLRVTVGDQPPVDVPIVASTPTVFGAAFAFSDVEPYAAALVDASGAVIQDLEPVAAPSSP